MQRLCLFTVSPKFSKDIALLKMTKPANLTRYVSPIALNKRVELPAYAHQCRLDARANQVGQSVSELEQRTQSA